MSDNVKMPLIALGVIIGGPIIIFLMVMWFATVYKYGTQILDLMGLIQ